MDTYAQVLLIAIPFFLILLITESLYGWIIKKQTFKSFDTISSLSSGITNTVKNILGLVVVVVGYTWMYEHLALIHIEATIVVYIISFILIDLAGYTQHVMAHKINFFWNEHMIHHSSEEFNLACALRQTISNIVSIQAFLLIPAALLGMPPKVIATLAPLHLFLQFWYHTRHIGKLGFLEYLIITPSQHRVHHAINPEYIDKNLGQIFPWWDRLFGTFQEELDEVPCVYGIKKPASTWNPILINYQHIWILIKDAWRTKNWKAKMLLWFKPTGWRPEDVKEKYPIQIIEDPFTQIKYDSQGSISLHIWSWIQLIMTHVFLIYMLMNMEAIGFPRLFVFGGFMMIHIYGYTTLMDLDRYAVLVETIKFVGGSYWIYNTGDWFGINAITTHGAWIMMAYLTISYFMTVYFSLTELTREPKAISL
ncbi:MAG: sterol desaturase family protein [Reichenbachiella sp.]